MLKSKSRLAQPGIDLQLLAFVEHILDIDDLVESLDLDWFILRSLRILPVGQLGNPVGAERQFYSRGDIRNFKQDIAEDVPEAFGMLGGRMFATIVGTVPIRSWKAIIDPTLTNRDAFAIWINDHLLGLDRDLGIV